MTNGRSTAGHEKGFTLVELVIGLTLVMLITTALFGGLRVAVRAWESGDDAVERDQEIRLVRNWLRRQLAQARPLLVREEPGELTLAFAGEAQTVRFVAPLPGHLGGGGLSQLTVRIAETSAAQHLIVEHELFHPEPLANHARKQKVLLSDVAAIRFAYFGAQEADVEPSWYGSWSEVQYLPSLIHLQVRFAEGEATDWTPLLVAPMIDGQSRVAPVWLGRTGA